MILVIIYLEVSYSLLLVDVISSILLLSPGYVRPASEPWCLDPETRKPVSCGVPVCGRTVNVFKILRSR